MDMFFSRIQQRKSANRLLPKEKKLERLASYSLCKVCLYFVEIMINSFLIL